MTSQCRDAIAGSPGDQHPSPLSLPPPVPATAATPHAIILEPPAPWLTPRDPRRHAPQAPLKALGVLKILVSAAQPTKPLASPRFMVEHCKQAQHPNASVQLVHPAPWGYQFLRLPCNVCKAVNPGKTCAKRFTGIPCPCPPHRCCLC
jgi:hypothetical protein